jgi:hypothetical protein
MQNRPRSIHPRFPEASPVAAAGSKVVPLATESVGCYSFGGDFGADAAFFSDFCFLAFAVFFGLLSPMVSSFLNVRVLRSQTPTTDPLPSACRGSMRAAELLGPILYMARTH